MTYSTLGKVLHSLKGTNIGLFLKNDNYIEGVLLDVNEDYLIIAILDKIHYLTINHIIALSKNSRDYDLKGDRSTYLHAWSLDSVLEALKYSWVTINILSGKGTSGVLTDILSNYIVLVNNSKQLYFQKSCISDIYEGEHPEMKQDVQADKAEEDPPSDSPKEVLDKAPTREQADNLRSISHTSIIEEETEKEEIEQTSTMEEETEQAEMNDRTSVIKEEAEEAEMNDRISVIEEETEEVEMDDRSSVIEEETEEVEVDDRSSIIEEETEKAEINDQASVIEKMEEVEVNNQASVVEEETEEVEVNDQASIIEKGTEEAEVNEHAPEKETEEAEINEQSPVKEEKIEGEGHQSVIEDIVDIDVEVQAPVKKKARKRTKAKNQVSITEEDSEVIDQVLYNEGANEETRFTEAAMGTDLQMPEIKMQKQNKKEWKKNSFQSYRVVHINKRNKVKMEKPRFKLQKNNNPKELRASMNNTEVKSLLNMQKNIYSSSEEPEQLDEETQRPLSSEMKEVLKAQYHALIRHAEKMLQKLNKEDI
ncbi:hypothetical protein [Ornithinibacillus bavariensis]|uniref:DUF2642 domain-containing protein n=1 Tax=Ornithinibacillus bavariensis TaxID=545502 RepID=A0A919XAY9_9BACI|nr:hypothetical protein [Ornithinibacillus bavariensis]GIO28088.1 hypothetical protein J43TS3_26990 [Ornithinibacillus bavariensis]